MTHRQIILVLLGLMSGMFLSALDQSVVSAAMRNIADDLHGLDAQAWVTTAYMITATVSTPIYGKLGDIFGHRRLFLIAISIFLAGSILAGFATSMYELAAFRAIQGVGAGGLFALALTILADIVPPRERAKYQGMFLAVFGTSSVLGPIVGGLFADASQILWVTGWRWVFLINIPIGAAALLMVVRFLHVPHKPTKARIDWWGAATLILGLVPLLIVAEQGRTWGWGSANSVSMFVLGGVGLVAFVVAEYFMKDDALIPLSVFRSPTFSMSAVLSVVVGTAMFGGMMTLPLLLQIAYGATSSEAGFLMIPMVMGLMVSSLVAGQITSRTGRYKPSLIVGTALMSGSYLFLGFVKPDWEIWQISIGMVILGVGLGQLMQTLSLAAQNSVPVEQIGVATAGATFFRQIGGTLGVAVFLSILFSDLASRAGQITSGVTAAVMAKPELLADPRNQVFAQPGAQVGDMIGNDSSFLKTVSPELASPIKEAFTQASATVFVVATAVALLSFVLSFFLKEIELRDKSASEERADALAAAGL